MHKIYRIEKTISIRVRKIQRKLVPQVYGMILLIIQTVQNAAGIGKFVYNCSVYYQVLLRRTIVMIRNGFIVSLWLVFSFDQSTSENAIGNDDLTYNNPSLIHFSPPVAVWFIGN